MNTQRMPVNPLAALDMQTILKKKKKRSYEDLIYVFFFFVFRLRVN